MWIFSVTITSINSTISRLFPTKKKHVIYFWYKTYSHLIKSNNNGKTTSINPCESVCVYNVCLYILRVFVCLLITFLRSENHSSGPQRHLVASMIRNHMQTTLAGSLLALGWGAREVVRRRAFVLGRWRRHRRILVAWRSAVPVSAIRYNTTNAHKCEIRIRSAKQRACGTSSLGVVCVCAWISRLVFVVCVHTEMIIHHRNDNRDEWIVKNNG